MVTTTTASSATHIDETYRRASNRSPLTWQSVRRFTSPTLSPALDSASHSENAMIAS